MYFRDVVCSVVDVMWECVVVVGVDVVWEWTCKKSVF